MSRSGWTNGEETGGGGRGGERKGVEDETTSSHQNTTDHALILPNLDSWAPALNASSGWRKESVGWLGEASGTYGSREVESQRNTNHREFEGGCHGRCTLTAGRHNERSRGPMAAVAKAKAQALGNRFFVRGHQSFQTRTFRSHSGRDCTRTTSTHTRHANGCIEPTTTLPKQD